MKEQNRHWIIGITGASGTAYARRLIDVLESTWTGLQIDVVISEAGARVMQEEEDLEVSFRNPTAHSIIGRDSNRIRFFTNSDIGAPIASGSALRSGMVIVPCSMSSMGAIAHGFGDKLIHRAAGVMLKEGRKLIIVPRETPLSTIHLKNMLALSEAGATMLPAMPGLYQRPISILQVIDVIAMKIADQMELPIELLPRWKKCTSKNDEQCNQLSLSSSTIN